MVRHIERFAVCDVCGTEGAGRHGICLDGAIYELDLCAEHELHLARVLAPFIRAAR